MAERRRSYYIDGSTVRKIEYSSAEPARRTREPERRRKSEPEQVPARKAKPQSTPRVSRRQQDRSWVDELKYGIFMSVVIGCAVVMCSVFLKLKADVKDAKNTVSSLESELSEQQDANAEYSSGLDSMTDLQEIYKIATEELGMVYSEPGQTVYYSQNSDDYVVQYKNVPGTD